MKKADRTKIINLVFILLAVAFLVFTAAYSIRQETTERNIREIGEDEDLVIASLNVGKGDCSILAYQGSFGLIDTGAKDSYDIIDKVLSLNHVQTIDYLIITHYDKDHVGSAVKLLQNYHVKKIYLPVYVSSKSGYSKLQAEIQGNKNVVYVSEEELIPVNDMTIRLIPPKEPEVLQADPEKMDNNMSLMCMVTLKNTRFLFTGDIEESRIQQILDHQDDVRADWLKVPYHGAYLSNSNEFLAAVSPRFAVISTGNERPADARLLVELAARNIRDYTTVGGSIATVSDGDSITVSYLE